MSEAQGPDPDSELAAALALDRLIYTRAGRVQPVSGGWVVRRDELPAIYFLNYLRLAAPLPASIGAAEITALADRRLGDLGHRHVVLEDGDAGETVYPELEARGWERRRTLLMALRSDPAGAPDDPRAREVSEDELRALQAANLLEEDFGPHTFPGLPELLADAQAALREASPWRAFGAGEAGELQSSCTVFLEADVHGRRAALLEHVATLGAARERGLATAAVGAALRAAGQWGAELIVVPADADDWPQIMYFGLGFEPIGRMTIFTLRAPV